VKIKRTKEKGQKKKGNIVKKESLRRKKDKVGIKKERVMRVGQIVVR
jgi:hypothetical protein